MVSARGCGRELFPTYSRLESSVNPSRFGPLLIAAASLVTASVAVAADKSPITVADLVRFAKIGDPYALNDDEDYDEAPGVFSADGKHVAIVVRRGNVAAGTNDGTLLVYPTATLLSDPKPITVARFSSTSNAHPIAFVRWLPDNQSLIFGATDGEKAQVYRASIKGGKPEQLTSETEVIAGFDVDAAGKRLIVSTIPKPTPPVSDPECVKRGCLVDAGTVWDARFGRYGGTHPLVVKDIAGGPVRVIEGAEKRVATVRNCYDPVFGSGLSPDGRYVLRMCEHKQGVEPWWTSYRATPRLRECIDYPTRGCWRQLELVDLDSGKAWFVQRAPMIYRAAQPLWIDGGRYLVIPQAIEPLDDVDAAEKARRQQSLAVLLVDPKTGAISRIARLPAGTAQVTEARWDAATQSLIVKAQDEKRGDLPAMRYTRRGARWTAAPAGADEAKAVAASAPVRLEIAQSLNDRPVLVAIDTQSGARKTILDPDPWLAERELGKVEPFQIVSKGEAWKGAVYYPPDYKAGTRYPVVIQTHGFDEGVFSLDGYSRNYAGRAIAAQGMLVLQIQEQFGLDAAPVEEYPNVKAGWEAAIDELDKRGLIDRKRVAIQGWSRTGPQMGYTMTQSDYPFAAGAFTSTADFSWFWYFNAGTSIGQDNLYGAQPFGKGMKPWLEKSAGFNLDRLRTPMLMWGEDVGLMWDWYAALRKLKKPVEYWNAQDGAHDIFQVPQRLRMNQLLVDWFQFWLTGKERAQVVAWGGESAADLEKQYARWRVLRKQQDAILAQPRPPLLEWTATPRGSDAGN